ncbi:hypothetical protein VI03_21085 [Burkholderia vietnamiensis]|nr:hypothetical protein VI03_21085 [Burkholderia vietnamiensis]
MWLVVALRHRLFVTGTPRVKPREYLFAREVQACIPELQPGIFGLLLESRACRSSLIELDLERVTHIMSIG